MNNELNSIGLKKPSDNSSGCYVRGVDSSTVAGMMKKKDIM